MDAKIRRVSIRSAPEGPPGIRGVDYRIVYGGEGSIRCIWQNDKSYNTDESKEDPPLKWDVQDGPLHWSEFGDRKDDNLERGIKGSKTPIACDVMAPDGCTLVFDCSFAKEIEVGKWTLRADFEGLECGMASEDAKLIQKEKDCHIYRWETQFKPPWARKDFPWGIAGDVAWGITRKDDGQPQQPLGITRLEIYAITPSLPPLFQGAVDVSFLRTFVLPARASWDSPRWSTHVAKAVFSSFGFLYDSMGGGIPRYSSDSLSFSFDLRRWCQDVGKHSTVNCYDSAAIVQIALGLGPPEEAKCQYMYMEPFGFINTTELVGRGWANNPFPDIVKTKNEVTAYFPFLIPSAKEGKKDEKGKYARSSFRTHSFIRLGGEGGKIIDACVGPHIGTESLDEYIKKSIDMSPNHETKEIKDEETGIVETVKLGEVEDAIAHGGVRMLNRCPIASDMKIKNSWRRILQDRRNIVIALMNKSRENMSSGASGGNYSVSFKISKITALLASNGVVTKPSFRLSDNGVVATYNLPYNLPDGADWHPVMIQISALASVQRASEYFKYTITNWQNLRAESWSSIKDESLKEAASLIHEPRDVEDGSILWTHGNLMIQIDGYESSDDLWKNYGKDLATYLTSCPTKTETLSARVNVPPAFPAKPDQNLKIELMFNSKDVRDMTYSVFDKTWLDSDIAKAETGVSLRYSIPERKNTSIDGLTTDMCQTLTMTPCPSPDEHEILICLCDCENSLRFWYTTKTVNFT